MRLFDWLRMPFSTLEAPTALGFEVYDYKAERAETIGDLAVPVGGALAIWDAKTGRVLEFELTAIEATKGDKAVARFIARKRNTRTDRVEAT